MQFEKAIRALCGAGVDFVVIGGLSATFHGSSQVTYHLDVCFSIRDEATLLGSSTLTLQSDLGEIDLLAEVAGLGTFEEVKSQSVVVEAFGRQVATINLPALIQAKRAAGRPKDLAALPELESLLDAAG